MESVVACSESTAVSVGQGVPKPAGLSLLYAAPLCHLVPCAELSQENDTAFKNVSL